MKLTVVFALAFAATVWIGQAEGQKSLTLSSPSGTKLSFSASQGMSRRSHC